MWFAPAVPVRINWTTSAPLGLYSTHRTSNLTRYDLVALCLTGTVAALGHARGYLSAGTCPSGTSPVLKQVVAVAGDEVELQRDFFAINGRVIDQSRRELDSLGRPLEAPPFGNYVVREEEIWVLGTHREHSWDSRYFGPVSVSTIAGIARPLLTLSLGAPL